MNTFVILILFLLMLSVIICIHEWGHLRVAKHFGVYCFEYSFGMGPVLHQWKKGETVYSLRALPVGGFVSMAGEEDGDAAYPDVTVPEGRRLTDQAPWKRILIMLAGIFMNFVLAYLIFTGLVLYSGTYVSSPRAEIAAVVADSPAESAGLKAGDVIEKITFSDGYSVSPKTFTDLQYALAADDSFPITFKVSRDGADVEVAVTPVYDEEAGGYRIGIQGPQAAVHDVNILNCWKYGASEMVDLTRAMFQSIGRLFTRGGMKQLSGPVGIYSATEQSVSYGAVGYLVLIAELSLNVGIFNLFPLPVLDGGQVLFTIAEWISGHPVNQKVKMAMMLATWALLIVLMIAVTWNDIGRLV